MLVRTAFLCRRKVLVPVHAAVLCWRQALVLISSGSPVLATIGRSSPCERLPVPASGASYTRGAVVFLWHMAILFSGTAAAVLL